MQFKITVVMLEDLDYFAGVHTLRQEIREKTLRF